MKGKLMGYTFVVTVLLIWAAWCNPEGNYGQCVEEQPDVITAAVYSPGLAIWSEWVRSRLAKGRPYRNPQRRYRLNKKRRRRLQQQWWCLMQKERASRSGRSSGLLARGNCGYYDQHLLDEPGRHLEVLSKIIQRMDLIAKGMCISANDSWTLRVWPPIAGWH